MAEKKEKNYKWLAAIITLLLGVGIVELLMFTSMRYNLKASQSDDTDKLLQDSIVFGGEEYIALGDLLEPIASDELAPNGDQTQQQSDATADDQPQLTGQNDLTDQGAIDEPPKQQVTAQRQSPMQVQQQPPKKPQAQAKTNAPATKPQKQGPAREQASSSTRPTPSPSAASSRVSNAFGKKNGNGQGAQGSPSGTAGEKAVGRPGVSGLDGYTLEHFPTSTCPGPGTVVIRVTVSPTGSVIRANVTGGSLRSNQRACNICLNLAHKSRFRVPKNTNVERTGTLTYKIN